MTTDACGFHARLQPPKTYRPQLAFARTVLWSGWPSDEIQRVHSFGRVQTTPGRKGEKTKPRKSLSAQCHHHLRKPGLAFSPAPSSSSFPIFPYSHLPVMPFTCVPSFPGPERGIPHTSYRSHWQHTMQGKLRSNLDLICRTNQHLRLFEPCLALPCSEPFTTWLLPLFVVPGFNRPAAGKSLTCLPLTMNLSKDTALNVMSRDDVR